MSRRWLSDKIAGTRFSKHGLVTGGDYNSSEVGK